MKALVCLILHFLLLLSLYISATLSFVQMVGISSHSNLFLNNWMQVCTTHTVVRKSK